MENAILKEGSFNKDMASGKRHLYPPSEHKSAPLVFPQCRDAGPSMRSAAGLESSSLAMLGPTSAQQRSTRQLARIL